MTTHDPSPAQGLPRTLLVLLGAAAAVIIVAGLHGLEGLIGPAFLALVMTICAHPLRGWLARHGVPGWLATTLVIVVVYGVLLVLVLSLVVAVSKLAELLPTYQQDLQDLVSDATATLGKLGIDENQISAVTKALDPGQALSVVSGVFGGLLSVLSSLFFIVTLLIFLAADGGSFPRMLGALAAPHDRFAGAMLGFAAGTRTYLLVSTIFGFIVALLDVALLYWLGIPLPWLWGLLAFITNYIPNVGFVIGLIPPLILGLLESGWSGALAVLAGYCVLNVVIQSVIQPRFVGQAVGLSTSLTFLSLVFWAWVFGALGALLAIPLSLCARALLVDADPANRWLVPLLTGREDPPPEPEEEPVLSGDPAPPEQPAPTVHRQGDPHV
jgi:AI-2 transport protein TqsA